MEFGDWLRMRLAERGWTDVQLCARFAELGLRVSQGTVNSWLKRGNLPRAPLVTGLCEIFGCTAGDMFPLPKRVAA